MRISYIFTLLLFLIGSCSRDKHNFTVEVNVSGSDENQLYLAQRTLSGTVVVDSAMPRKSGTYVLEGYTRQPDFYILYKQPRQFINLIIHPGDEFKVLTESSGFDTNYLIEGSKDSRLIQKMIKMQIRTLEKITEISTEYENSIGSKDFEQTKTRVDSIYEKTVEEHRQFSMNLIKENPKSLVSLMALYQQLGRNISVFDSKKDIAWYERVDSNLSDTYPNSEAVIDLNRKITELKDVLRLEIGAKAPEISLPDRDDKISALSSLQNKYVLIVFWASWSEQSMSEMKYLASLYPKLKENDLEYYLVSLDKTRETWIKGIDEIKAGGIYVSDLKYWDSPVVSLFRIEQLPVLYLLDKDGSIIDKNFTANEFPEILKQVGNQ